MDPFIFKTVPFKKESTKQSQRHTKSKSTKNGVFVSTEMDRTFSEPKKKLGPTVQIDILYKGLTISYLFRISYKDVSD